MAQLNTTMGWEKKPRGGDSRYYYRTIRIGQKTTKVYVGTGLLAEIAAQLDEIERDDRRTERSAWLAEQIQLAAADATLDALRGMASLLTHATLLLAGFHWHRGEWRKWRRVHGRTRGHAG